MSDEQSNTTSVGEENQGENKPESSSSSSKQVEKGNSFNNDDEEEEHDLSVEESEEDEDEDEEEGSGKKTPSLADLMSGNASDSDSEDDGDFVPGKRKSSSSSSKKGKSKGHSFVEEEAEVSDDHEVSADEEDDGSDLGDFIAAEGSVSEDSDIEVKKRSRRKKKDAKASALDADLESSDDEDKEERSKSNLKRLKTSRDAAEELELLHELEELKDDAARDYSDDDHDQGRGQSRAFLDENQDDEDDDDDGFIVGSTDQFDGDESMRRAQEIFGDLSMFFQGSGVAEEDTFEREEELPSSEDAIARLRRLQEPSDLTAKYLTAGDDSIREVDIPERLQARAKQRLASPSFTIQDEAEWILKHAFPMRDTIGVKTVIDILKYMREEHLDIPFIQTYRKDYWSTYENPLLNFTHQELWVIDEWDQRWESLMVRRERLLALILEHDRGNDELLECTRDAKDVVELNDVLHVLVHKFHISRKSALRDVDAAEGSSRRSQKSSLQDMEDINLSDDSDEEYKDGDNDDGEEDSFKTKKEPEEDAPVAAVSSSSAMDVEGETTAGTPATAGTATAGASSSSSSSSSSRPAASSSSSAMEVERDDNKPALTARQEMQKKLEAIVLRFCLSGEQLGENMRFSYQRHMPSDPDLSEWSLDAAADELICSRYSSREAVLKAIRRTAVRMLFVDPHVKKSFRKRFLDFAVISTRPTRKGWREMTWTHRYYPVRKIVCKPVARYMSTTSPEFLLLTGAEKEGFITANVFVPGTHTDPILARQIRDEGAPAASDTFESELKELFLSTTGSADAFQMNDFRSLIIHDALVEYLYPMAQKYVRMTLLREAQEAVALEAAMQLRHMATEGSFPYPEDSRKRLCIMGAVVGGAKEPSYFVVVNEFGEVLDFVILHFIKSRTSLRHNDDRELHLKKKADMARLAKLVANNEPAFCGIGANSPQCEDFKVDVEKALRDFPQLRIGFVPTDVGRVFMNSERATEELPDYTPSLRMAVSIARRCIDPLNELCGLFRIDSTTGQNDILALDLHPLQREIPPHVVLPKLKTVLIDMVCAVGVDFNALVTRPFLAPVLNFVCGLGPRKASALLDAVKRQSAQIDCRTQLVTDEYMGPTVYQNCAGFLRIRPISEYVRELKLDVSKKQTILDQTRIHPEHYWIVYEMVENAMDHEANDDAKAREALLAVQMRSENLPKLDELDLVAFAEMEFNEGHGLLLSNMRLIREELYHPFSDLRIRREFAEPNEKELFFYFTGETETTMRRGQMVNTNVVKILPAGVIVKLESGVKGFIARHNISDNANYHDDMEAMEWMQTKVQPGMQVTCRVLDVHYNKMEVNLTCRSSELQSKEMEKRDDMDHMYAQSGIVSDDERFDEEERERRSKMKRFVARNIVHPVFQNVSRQEAEEYLERQPVGEVVVRPSSKGQNNLTISWKYGEDHVCHLDVEERGKANPDALGRSLVLDGNAYEDLDEILYRAIKPMNEYAKQLSSSTYFRFGTDADVEEIIRVEKQTQPKRIPYFFSYSSKYPGVFRLTYLPARTVEREYVYVTPQGYKYRDTYIKKVVDLISKFKKTAMQSFASRGSSNRHQPPHHGGPPPPHHHPQHMPPHMPHQPPPHGYPPPHHGGIPPPVTYGEYGAPPPQHGVPPPHMGGYGQAPPPSLFRAGDECQVQLGDGQWYPGVIDTIAGPDNYVVKFGRGNTTTVPGHHLRR